MSPTPLQHEYLQAIYSITIEGRSFACMFAAGRFARMSACPGALPPQWAIISARNPMSRALPEAENRRRDEAFAIRTQDMRRVVAAAGRSRDGTWAEPSRALLGIKRADALAIAREFEQRAIVWAEGERVGIIDCPSERWTIRPVVWS